MSRPRGFVVLGYAVTALHPGVGRAPGTVDLPVQRDPMGYPMVYASSVKGAFKAECGRRAEEDNKVCFDNNGRINCENCPLCCCLFGHELGGEPAAGLLSVLDLVPLFFPVPSLSHGYLYVTTPYLAARAAAILEAIDTMNKHQNEETEELEGLKQFLKNVKDLELDEGKAVACSIQGEKVYVGATELNIKEDNNDSRRIKQSCNGLNIIRDLGGLASAIPSRLVVVSDVDGPVLIEKGLIRLTRVKLRVDKKTVAGSALWTEEYIPHGTVFLGGFAALTPRANKYCCKELAKDNGNNCIVRDSSDVSTLLGKFMKRMSGDSCQTYAIVGGKETIGKGVLFLKLKPCPSKGDGQ